MGDSVEVAVVVFEKRDVREDRLRLLTRWCFVFGDVGMKDSDCGR